MKKQRLDLALVERGLATTQAKAAAMVLAGQVVVDEQRVDKPGAQVGPAAVLRLKGEVLPYVSRGGLKLRAALEAFSLDVRNAVCADIGASTGGFTDCLLQAGAARVHAIDVGYGQLHEKLRVDPRVIQHERVNARHLTDDDLPEAVDVVVVDVSFISLTVVLPPVLAKLKPKGLVVALVKPQFEVDQTQLGEGGVVRDEAARRAAIDSIRAFATSSGLVEIGVIDSPVHGPAGNVEALLALKKL